MMPTYIFFFVFCMHILTLPAGNTNTACVFCWKFVNLDLWRMLLKDVKKGLNWFILHLILVLSIYIT